MSSLQSTSKLQLCLCVVGKASMFPAEAAKEMAGSLLRQILAPDLTLFSRAGHVQVALATSK